MAGMRGIPKLWTAIQPSSSRGPRRRFFFVASCTLGLAVGANAVIFAIANALWLRPPALSNPDNVVMITRPLDPTRSGQGEGYWVAKGGLDAYRRLPCFTGVAGQVATSGINAEYLIQLHIAQVGRLLETAAVTPDYFAVLGLTLRGRDFVPNDDEPGAMPVAVISDHLWRTSFGASTGVVGTMIQAAPVAIRIIGVAPEGFQGVRRGELIDVWVARQLVPTLSRTRLSPAAAQRVPMLAFGRLAPGWSLSAAVQEVTATRGGIQLIPVRHLYGFGGTSTAVVAYDSTFSAAFLAGGLILAVCGVTLFALVATFYAARSSELMMRLALGCTPVRLGFRLSLELLSVFTAGAAIALGLTLGLLRVLPAVTLPSGIDLARLDLSPDWRVIAFASLFSLLTIVAAAAMPLARSLNVSPAGLVSHGRTPSRLPRFLAYCLTVHAGVTVVTVVIAMLLLRSISNGLTVTPQFDVERTVFIETQIGSPTGTRFASEERIQQDLEVALQRLGALAAVEIVTFGGSPFAALQATVAPGAADFEVRTGTERIRFGVQFVGPAYFDAMGLRLLAGRGFTAVDQAEASTTTDPEPVVVTESFAKALWPGQTPIGEHFRLVGAPRSQRVVGVASDVAFGSLTEPLRNAWFSPMNSFKAARQHSVMLVVRSPNPEDVVSTVRRVVDDVFPYAVRRVVVTGVSSMRAQLGREILTSSFLSGIGLLALLIGGAGVFGVVSYASQVRRRDVAIHIALGATPRQTNWLVLREALRPVGIGIVAGVAVSVLVAQALRGIWIGVPVLNSAYWLVGAGVLIWSLIAGILALHRLRRLSPADLLKT